MTATALKLAQDGRRSRGEQSLTRDINAFLDELDTHLSQADKVGPAARKKLMPILRKYAKSAKPFTECVRDQVKNGLAKDLANRRCAVLKDIIEGTTKWRGKKTPMTPLPQYLSDDLGSCPVLDLDDETTQAIDKLGEALDAHNFIAYSSDLSLSEDQFAQLTAKQRKKLKPSDYAIPEKKMYPIHNTRHAQNALARVAEHGTDEEKKRVRAAVKNRYPNMAIS